MRGRQIPSRTVHLFRALFPSWQFFDDIDSVPILFYRTSAQEENFGPWLSCIPKQKRSLGSLLLNPNGNFALACGSLLNQLHSDLEDFSVHKIVEFENSVSYQLVKNLVTYQIAKTETVTSLYQFKIALADPKSPSNRPEDFIISPVYELKRP